MSDQPPFQPQQPYQAPQQPFQQQQPFPPQQPLYPPPAAVAPLSPAEARQWSMLAHLSGILFGFLGPLVVMLVFGPRDGFTKDQSTEALNFQITLMIGWVAAILLSAVGIGLLLFPVVWIGGLVLSIMAGLAANNGQPYRYPVCLRLVS
jgi:uncharacterized Tic20 family protein